MRSLAPGVVGAVASRPGATRRSIPQSEAGNSTSVHAATKSNIKTAQTAEETYATDNNGSYTAATTGASASTTDPLVSIEPALKNDPAVTATTSTGGYTLVATSSGPSGSQTVYTLAS